MPISLAHGIRRCDVIEMNGLLPFFVMGAIVVAIVMMIGMIIVIRGT